MKPHTSAWKSGARPLTAIARLWWIAARRQWRQNTTLPFALAGLVVIIVVDLTLTPEVNGALYLSVLTGAALTVALLAPTLLHAESVFESQRFDLLPFEPFVIFLVRPLFGNPFRLLLAMVVLVGCGNGIVHLTLPHPQIALELLKLLGLTLSGLIAIEIVEEILRRTSSVLLYSTLVLLLAMSLVILATLPRAAHSLTPGSFSAMHGPLTSVLIGGDAGTRWEVAAAITPAILFLALLALGKLVTERCRAFPPRTRQPAAWVRPIRDVARVVAPRAPASFGKELGYVTRVKVYWISYAYFFAVSAAAFSAQNPSLFAGAFLLWIGAGYNTLGPDVPMGGLVRYRLIPRSVNRTLAMRHAAVLVASVVTALAALGFVAAVGSLGRAEPHSIEMPPSAYLIWFVYGASLFLLSTIAGDWVSAREPRAIGLRSVTQGGMGAGTATSSVVWLVAFFATLAMSGVFILGATMLLGALATNTDSPSSFSLPILATSVVQLGVYGYKYTRFR